MYVMTIKSIDSEVTIYSDIYIYNDLEKCVEQMVELPEIELIENPRKVSEYCIKCSNSSENKTMFDDNIIYFFYSTENEEIASILLYLAYPLIEKQNSIKHKLTCHAAAVKINEKSVLLLGKEGAGKTSLALYLCRKYNAELIANDLCIVNYNNINEPVVEGGTKFLYLRYESIKRNYPELLGTVFKESNKDTWINKRKVDPELLGVCATSQSSIIKEIFLIHIDSSQKDIYVNDANNLTNKLYVNENFSRYIRNTCTASIINGDIMGYIPSLDNKEFFSQRKEFINQIFNKNNVKYISGNLKDVGKYIYDLYEGS